MVSITGEQLQKKAGLLRAEARRHPVEVIYHGRAELVVMSIDDYELLASKPEAGVSNRRNGGRKD